MSIANPGMTASSSPDAASHKAPYVPFVNERKPGKRRQLHPSKYPANATSYRGKGLRARAVGQGGSQPHRLRPGCQQAIPEGTGVAEPKPAWGFGRRCGPRHGRRWREVEARASWRCAPINSSLSSLPPLTRFFQFPLLPWEPEYAEFFNTPGLRPNRPILMPSTHRDSARFI